MTTIARLNLKTHTRAEFDALTAHPVIGTEPVYISDQNTLGFIRREGEGEPFKVVLDLGVPVITQAAFTAMGLGASPAWPARGTLFYVDGQDDTSFRTRELWVGTGVSTAPRRLTGNDAALFMLWEDFYEVGDTALSSLIDAIHTSSNSFVEGCRRAGSPVRYGVRQVMASEGFALLNGVSSIGMLAGPAIWAQLDLTPCKRITNFLMQSTVFTQIQATNLFGLTQFIVTSPYSIIQGKLGKVLFQNCPALNQIGLYGQPLLNTSTINEIFAALPDRNGKSAGTITVTGCTNLGSMNTALADALNWIVVN